MPFAQFQNLAGPGKKNGELLQLIAGEGFDVFLTVDQNIPFQQRLSQANFGVVVLSAVSNRLADLLPLVPAVLSALQTIQLGDIVEIKE